MIFYSWVTSFLWMHIALAVTTTVTHATVDSAGIKTISPRLQNTTKHHISSPDVYCVNLHYGPSPSVALYRDLSSRFCLFAEGEGPLKQNVTLERSYLLNRVWYTFSATPNSVCTRPRPSIDVSGDKCIQDLDVLWSRCRDSLQNDKLILIRDNRSRTAWLSLRRVFNLWLQ